MKIIVTGAAGRMGAELKALLGDDLVCGVDPAGEVKNINDYAGDADGIIDFSFHGAIPEIADYAVKRGLPLVVCTTGHTPEELAKINEAAKSVPVFFSANMCIGIAVLCRLAKEAVKYFPDADIEIIEKHHNRKLDAPSGTALMLAKEIASVREDAKFVYGRVGQAKREQGEIGIHAVRMGNIVGDHEIIVGTDTQRITLKHEAVTRAIFAEGAVTAMQFLQGREAGLYDMKDMIK
jgi:4-hydroxy-tetrahydrodipicolinate reductase